MIVSPNHSNVDSEGLVRLPYLDNWRNSSTLIDLVKNLQTLFGEKPPLFSKPQTARLSVSQPAVNISSRIDTKPNAFQVDVTRSATVGK